MNFIRKKNIIKIIKKIFLLIFCIFFCLGVITRIYAKNKNIFLEKDYEQAEKNLIFKISVDIFGEIDSNFFENFDFIIKKVSNKKDEKECLEEIKNYFDDLNLRNIFLNFQKKNNSDEYKKKLEKFIKNHKIYEENSLLESEKKIAYIYKNIIVKNIYRDFFDDKLYYYKAFEKEQYDFFNDCFERYFFGSHNGKILKEYLKEFKFTKKNKDNKNYDNKNNYIFNKLNFKKYYFYDDVSCYGSHIFNKFILKEHCFNGYCKSLLNIYLLYNINDIIKDKVFYNIGVFHVDYNK